MPNTIDATGVAIQPISEILGEIQNGASGYPGMLQIFGSGINVNPNSPDGQMINIFAQAKRDTLEFIQMIFASMDPDQATGAVLDQRCAINGITRLPGTYTQVYVNVTATQAVALYGSTGASPSDVFVITDAQGNRYDLVGDYTFTAAGTQLLFFQAENYGPLSAAAGTLTSIATITLGISSVTNPAGPATTGTNEETDSQLRLRRTFSVGIPSIGYAQALLGALLNIPGVTQAEVFENATSTTDAYGTPAHSIWPVVLGGADLDVATVIYTYKSAGCGMRGATSVTLTPSGALPTTIYFDRPTVQTLYFQMTISAITGSLDTAWIRTQILNNFSYQIGQVADSTAVVAYVKNLAPNALISGEGVSATGATYTPSVSPTGLNYQFVLSAATIYINGSHG